MRLAAPERAITGVWNEQLGIFEDRPEPVSRWIVRAILDARATARRDIELTLAVGYEIQTELLKELVGLGFGMARPDRIYGAKVELDANLTIPFELRWTTPEEAAVEELRRELDAWARA